MSEEGKKIIVNMFAEGFIGEANGVTTAFVEAVDALTKRRDIELKVNGKEPYDVLHSQTIGPRFFFKRIGKKHKTIVSAHVVPDSFIGSLVFSRLWRPLAKWYLKFIYDRAQAVIAVSPKVGEELEKLGVKSKVYVLCNSVNREKFKPNDEAREEIRRKHNLSLEKKVAICVGQIQPRKGVDDFVAVAEALPGVTFMWVGGRPYGKLTQEHERMTEVIKNAPKNVIWAGIVKLEQMPAYYAAADIYFMPSFQENFAFATIEAASTKLPLVMRDNIEYPDSLFTHYLKAKDAEGFTALIKKLITDQPFFLEYQNESDALANKYEINAYTDKIVKIYKDVAANNK